VNSSFWTTSPCLIVIRTGITLLLLTAAYVWTEYCVGPGWSWMQCLGRNSLMVYWIHVMLVYGDISKRFKRLLSIPETAFATLTVILLMVALSAAWLRWKAQRAERWRLATKVAGSSGEALKAY
jgi:fucose 4-O-acetylase-like acetyltransferase